MGALLAPLFTLGFLALAVPIALHFYRRRSNRVHAFPTLRFLVSERLPSQKFRQLKRLLILLCRCIALSCLILAFAGLSCSDAEPLSGNATVILVDRSASMQAGDRFEKAIEILQAQLAEESGTKAVLLFSDHVEPIKAFEENTQKALSAARSKAAGYASSNPLLALKKADHLLGDTHAKTRKVVLISDFSGKTYRDLLTQAHLSHATEIDSLPVSQTQPENIAVTHLETQRLWTRNGVELEVSASIRNHGATSVIVDVSLETQQGHRETNPLAVEAHAGGTAVFRVPINEDAQRIAGEVWVETEDGFAMDDKRRFAMKAKPGYKVLHVSPMPEDNAPANRFLRTAFSVVNGPAQFDWSVSAQVPNPEIAQAQPDVVIMNVRQFTQAETKRSWTDWVESGGLLLLLPAPEQPEMSGSPHFKLESLGLSYQGIQRRRGKERMLSTLEYGHPYLNVFDEYSPLFHILFSRTQDIEFDEGTTLAGFRDDRPAIVSLEHGSGNVLAFAFRFEREWTDWPLSPTFLPFLHHAVVRHYQGADETAKHTPSDKPNAPYTEPGLFQEKETGNWVAVNLAEEESDLSPLKRLQEYSKLVLPNQTRNAIASRTPHAFQQTDSHKDALAMNLIGILLAVALLAAFVELILSNQILN